jgi:hypothetical protein
MSFREAHEGEDIGLRAVHQLGEFRELPAQLIGHGAPLADCRLMGFLGKKDFQARYPSCLPSESSASTA